MASGFNYQEAFSRNLGWVTEAEQALLSQKCVAIAGMGGVGGGHLLSLARLGVGRFRISDFDQFELERKQPFAADGALLMPLPDIAARLIFWEKFVDAHPGFILMEEASLTYSYYVLVLLIGMDNTPAFDYQNQTLRKNFRDVYQLVVSKYPGSSSAAIFQEYLKLLRSSGWKQTEQVDEFVRQFAIL